eukprot:8452774-Alexandrium_andersonii.AAC.1
MDLLDVPERPAEAHRQPERAGGNQPRLRQRPAANIAEGPPRERLLQSSNAKRSLIQGSIAHLWKQFSTSPCPM